MAISVTETNECKECVYKEQLIIRLRSFDSKLTNSLVYGWVAAACSTHRANSHLVQRSLSLL